MTGTAWRLEQKTKSLHAVCASRSFVGAAVLGLHVYINLVIMYVARTARAIQEVSVYRYLITHIYMYVRQIGLYDMATIDI